MKNNGMCGVWSGSLEAPQAVSVPIDFGERVGAPPPRPPLFATPPAARPISSPYAVNDRCPGAALPRAPTTGSSNQSY